MKKIFSRIFAVLTALLLLTGCGTEAPVPTETADSTEKTEATTTYSSPEPSDSTLFSLPFSFSPDQLNPYLDGEETNAPVYSLLFDGLFGTDETGTPVLRLAESISVDGLTVTIRLRTDATFHNGTALRPADVVWSLENARDNDSSVYRARLANIAAISASGTDAVVLTLYQPEGDLTYMLDVPIIRLGTGFSSPADGTGRYKLVDSDGSTYLLSNDSWFGLQDGETFPLRLIRLTDISEEDCAVDTDRLVYAMVSGNASLIRLDAFAVTPATLTGNADAYPLETRNFLYIAFNTSYYAPTSDKTLRQAVAGVLDLQTLLTEILPAVSASDGLYPACITGGGTAETEKTNRSAAAVRMRQAGYTQNADGFWTDSNGETLTFTLIYVAEPEKKATAVYLQQALTDFGIETEITATDDMNTALKNGRFDLALCEACLSPDYDFRFLLASDGSSNYNGYTVFGLDELLTDFYESGRKEGADTAAEINRLISTDKMILPIGYKIDTVYVNRAFRFGNIVPRYEDLFCNLTDWIAY